MSYSAADAVHSSAVESGLHSDLQALLKDMSNQRASLKGRLRWSLERKVETDPSCSVSLIKVLLQELEKKLIQKGKSNMQIIPLLHTLYYVVIQSSSTIPTDLYQRVFQCLMKMLILPLPYSTVALSTLRSVKMEMNTPGSLYQRRVMAEQNLKNEHFTCQEKVLVLADPAVFSAPLTETLRAYLEVSNMLRDTPTVEKNLLLRVLQKGLGVVCQSSRLVQALEALGDQTVEKYFQKVVLAMEQSIKLGAGGCDDYMNRLQHIYRDILSACKEEMTTADPSSACSSPMLFPHIDFLLWKEEDDLWKHLVNFTLHGSFSVVEEEKNKRDSVRSEDSGIVRDLKESEVEDAEQPPGRNPAPPITRRNALRNTNSADKLSLMKEKMETFPGSPVFDEDRKHLTARVVVLGDNRVLGRLAKAYHLIRERESKRLILTKKLNLQWYYIPVTDVEPSCSSPDSSCLDEGRLSLAFFLGGLDPWYNHNINSLGATISKLPSMQCHSEPSEQNLYLLDNLCYYLRCGTQPVNLPLYYVKMTCSSGQAVEDVFVSHLEAEVPEFRHLKQNQEAFARRPRRTTVDVFGTVITVSYTETPLSKREAVKGEAPMTCGVVITSEPAAMITGEDFLTVQFDSLSSGYNTKIQTQNISIRTLEQRTLSVCLDKDSRRTYTNVKRIEISRCLDPGCNIFSRFSFRNKRELLLSKYLDNILSLPINTFSGVTP